MRAVFIEGPLDGERRDIMLNERLPGRMSDPITYRYRVARFEPFRMELDEDHVPRPRLTRVPGEYLCMQVRTERRDRGLPEYPARPWICIWNGWDDGTWTTP